MRKRHIHPIHVHGLSKSGNLRCFLPHYNSHPPKPEPCIFLYAPFTKEYFYRSSPRTTVKFLIFNRQKFSYVKKDSPYICIGLIFSICLRTRIQVDVYLFIFYSTM